MPSFLLYVNNFRIWSVIFAMSIESHYSNKRYIILISESPLKLYESICHSPMILCFTDSPRQSPRIPNKNNKPKEEKEPKVPKHDIVVVKDGTQYVKDPDPELTKLNTIPVFYPIMRGSLNVPISARDGDMLDKMDHQKLLDLCLRYQDHLKQLSEAVAFDQNALCVRIKEVCLSLRPYKVN